MTKTATKIKPKLFEITWSESAEADLDRKCGSWDSFNKLLTIIAADAPTGGAYHKTGFRITFWDGATYDGRFDVQNLSREWPDLKDHVRRFVGFHSGLIKPDHLTEADYMDHLRVYGPEARQEFLTLAETYEVGVDTDRNMPAGEIC